MVWGTRSKLIGPELIAGCVVLTAWAGHLSAAGALAGASAGFGSGGAGDVCRDCSGAGAATGGGAAAASICSLSFSIFSWFLKLNGQWFKF